MSTLLSRTEFGPRDKPNFEAHWDGDYLSVHLLTDVGRKRKNNEDAGLFRVSDGASMAGQRGMLFAVADGMGGAHAGERASHMALSALSDAYYGGENNVTAPIALKQALEHANDQVFEEAEMNPALTGMGTTVSAVALIGDWAYIAQVGDSRVYLLRERSGIHQLTEDHSLVAEQMRHGLISAEEARNHSLRNLITRAVGIKNNVKVDLFSIRLRRNDTMLLCSDGLTNHVGDRDLAVALADGDLQQGTRRVVGMALDEGGSDNITALTLRISGEPPSSDLQDGATLIDITPSGIMNRLRRLFS